MNGEMIVNSRFTKKFYFLNTLLGEEDDLYRFKGVWYCFYVSFHLLWLLRFGLLGDDS